MAPRQQFQSRCTCIRNSWHVCQKVLSLKQEWPAPCRNLNKVKDLIIMTWGELSRGPVARIFSRCFFLIFLFLDCRVGTRIYIARRSPLVLRSEDRRQAGEPILAPPRNEIFFASLNDDDSDPHVSDMFLMSNPPPSVPLGTVCIWCCWALSFCHSRWALFFYLRSKVSLSCWRLVGRPYH